MIPDTDDFHEAIKVGLKYVQDQKMVTFGIKPTHPETGMGYLELSKDPLDDNGHQISRALLKTQSAKLKQMLAADHYLWNAGIFLFRTHDMVTAFRAYAPETLDLVSQAVDGAFADLGFLRLASEPWSKLKDIWSTIRHYGEGAELGCCALCVKMV